MRFRSFASLPVMGALALLVAVGAAPGASAEGPQDVVNNAVKALEDMTADPNMRWFQENLPDAMGVVVFPTLIRGGFIVGAAGGNGVVLVRGPNGWSYPSFVTLAAINFGAQAGATGGQLILLVRTQAGLDAFLSHKFQLGADAGIAAGPAGVGAQAATTDILAFSRTAGLYAGVSVEGATIFVRSSWNEQYYSSPGIRPMDILVARNQSNVGAQALRQTVAQVGNR